MLNAGSGIARAGYGDLFFYNFYFPSLANGSTLTDSITIQADSDFVLRKITYFADIAGAAQTESGRIVALVNCNLTDNASGRSLMSEAVPLDAIAGEGKLPSIIPLEGRLFKSKSTVTMDLNNFSSSTTYKIRVVLAGYKVFG